jgi:hypothetical protein
MSSAVPLPLAYIDRLELNLVSSVGSWFDRYPEALAQPLYWPPL